MGKMKAKSEEMKKQSEPCCAAENYNNTCTCGIQEPSDAQLMELEAEITNLDWQDRDWSELGL